jgi:hypothetical protein
MYRYSSSYSAEEVGVRPSAHFFAQHKGELTTETQRIIGEFKIEDLRLNAGFHWQL